MAARTGTEAYAYVPVTAADEAFRREIYARALTVNLNYEGGWTDEHIRALHTDVFARIEKYTHLAYRARLQNRYEAKWDGSAFNPGGQLADTSSGTIPNMVLDRIGCVTMRVHGAPHSAVARNLDVVDLQGKLQHDLGRERLQRELGLAI